MCLPGAGTVDFLIMQPDQKQNGSVTGLRKQSIDYSRIIHSRPMCGCQQVEQPYRAESPATLYAPAQHAAIRLSRYRWLPDRVTYAGRNAAGEQTCSPTERNRRLPYRFLTSVMLPDFVAAPTTTASDLIAYDGGSFPRGPGVYAGSRAGCLILP